jgi:hypothetical protein
MAWSTHNRSTFAGSRSLTREPIIVLIAATENDSLYALDADAGAQLWKVALLPAGETPSDDRGCSQVTPTDRHHLDAGHRAQGRHGGRRRLCRGDEQGLVRELLSTAAQSEPGHGHDGSPPWQSPASIPEPATIAAEVTFTFVSQPV